MNVWCFFLVGGVYKGDGWDPITNNVSVHSQLPPTDLWTKLAYSYIKRPLSYWTNEWRENTAFTSGSRWRRGGQSYNPTSLPQSTASIFHKGGV